MKSSTKTTPTFGAVVADLTRGGFKATDLLPIIPPGARLSEASQVSEHQIGKIPGRYSGGVWSGLTGSWPIVGLSEADVERAKSWPTQNVGLRAGAYPCIDIDTDSREAFELVERLIVARFGDTPPVRYRGDAPRALFAFRLDPNSDPVRKHRIEWSDGERKHAVEVLGLGQQYVIAGLHPSGVAYEWRERRDPTSGKPIPGDLAAVTAAGLPPLHVNDVMEFMRELRDTIEACGWQVLKTYAPRYQGDGLSRAVDLAKAEPVLESGMALEALNAIPNDAETIPTREGFVGLLSSFKQAVGRNAESLRPQVLDWATRHGWADEAYFDKVWDSLTTSRVPVDHLISFARKFGWRGDAVLDFREFGEEHDNDGEVDRQIRRVEQEDPLIKLATKLAYIDTEQMFIVKATGDMYSPEALNRAPHLGATVADPGTTGRNSPANRLCRPNTPMQIVKGIVYLPGEPMLAQWTRNGRTDLFYNRWHARVFPLFDNVTDADVRPWLDHVAYLVPNEDERNNLLDFFAHVLQKRGTKIRWAPLIIGKQGTGKDLMIKPIVSYLAHNARDIKPEQLTARFNDFLESELLVVQELKRSITQANSTYNRIKTLIAGTAEDVNYIEKKYQTPYAVPNVVNFTFFSNYVDAMEIGPDDRRFFVINSEVDKREPAYYQHLAVDFYQTQSGWLKVASWLLKRDISGFNAAQPPMQTDGKAMLVEAQRSAVSRAVEEAVTTGPYKNRLAVTAEEIVRAGQSDFSFMPGVPRQEITTSAVYNELRQLGWTNYGTVKVKGRVLRFWSRPGASPSNDVVRAEYEKANPGG